jgi:hypothetical protein
MRRHQGVLAIMAVGLMTLSGCGRGGESGRAAGPVAPQARKDTAAVTEPYVSDEGNFRARFGGVPRVTSQEVESLWGPLTSRILQFETPDHTSYTVSYVDYPESKMQVNDLENVLDGNVTAMRGTRAWEVKAVQPLELNGHPGRSVQFEAHSTTSPEPGVGRARLYLVGPRLYQVIAIGTRSVANPDDLEAFVSSFQILKDVPPVDRRKPS